MAPCIIGGATGAGAAPHEDVVEHARHLLRIAVAQLIGAQRIATGVGAIEPRDPLRRALQEPRILGDDQHAVHARYRLELDHPLPDPAFLGLEDLLELGDHRIGRGRLQRIEAHRLVAQPLHVEARDRGERIAPLGDGALDHHQVASRVDADGARTRHEVFQRLSERGRRDVLQRHDRDAVTRLSGPHPDRPGPGGLAERHDPDEVAVAHGLDVHHAQRGLEHGKHVLAGDRRRRGQRHVALRARIDHVAQPQRVAEHALCDIRDARALEIERDALDRAGGIGRAGGRRARSAGALAVWCARRFGGGIGVGAAARRRSAARRGAKCRAKSGSRSEAWKDECARAAIDDRPAVGRRLSRAQIGIANRIEHAVVGDVERFLRRRAAGEQAQGHDDGTGLRPAHR